jgi:hypothetical protein
MVTSIDRSNWRPDWARWYDGAVAVLNHIASHGYGHNHCLRITEANRRLPVWLWRRLGEGWIELPPNTFPGVIAHELGHAFHQWMCVRWGLTYDTVSRQTREAYAEAIRFFVTAYLGEPVDRIRSAVLDRCGR